MVRIYMNCSHELNFFMDVVQIALSVPVVLINGALVFCLLLSSSRRRPYLWILASLAASDSLQGVNTLYLASLELSPGRGRQWGFLVGYCIFVFSIMTSLYSILVISVERYITISRLANNMPQRKKAWIFKATTSAWGLAMTFATMPLLGWECMMTLDPCTWSMAPMGIYYLVMVVVPHHVLGMSVLLVFHCKTRWCVVKWRARVRAKDVNILLAGIKTREVNTAKVLTWVSGGFMVLQGPIVALAFLEFNEYIDCHRLCLLKDIAVTLLLLSCFVRPLTCTLSLADVRAAVVKGCNLRRICDDKAKNNSLVG